MALRARRSAAAPIYLIWGRVPPGSGGSGNQLGGGGAKRGSANRVGGDAGDSRDADDNHRRADSEPRGSSAKSLANAADDDRVGVFERAAPAAAGLDRTASPLRSHHHGSAWTAGMEFPASRAVRLNPLAWCAWAVAALAAAFIDRNPYLQVVLLVVILNLWLPHRHRTRNSYWKLGALLALAPIVFSFALSRFGHHTIFRLPDLPVVGGAWTLDALAYGTSTGIALLLVVAIFGVLQTTVRSADLISLLPRPLYRCGTVFAMAVAFAPQTIAALRSISEARRLRGRRSGWRAAPGLLLPLLLTSLERALQYGESLDARGYGSGRRSRYRAQPWHAADLFVAGASAISLALVILKPATGYDPYQEIVPALPGINGFATILLLLVPAILIATPRTQYATDLV